MSGSKGGPRPQDPGTSCDELTFEADLASPKEEAVSQLAEGDILDVLLERVGEAPIVNVRVNGDLVGSLVSHLPELIRCLQEGNDFVAEIKEIDDGKVSVEVRPR